MPPGWIAFAWRQRASWRKANAIQPGGIVTSCQPFFLRVDPFHNCDPWWDLNRLLFPIRIRGNPSLFPAVDGEAQKIMLVLPGDLPPKAQPAGTMNGCS